MKKIKKQVKIALGITFATALVFAAYFYWQSGKADDLGGLIKIDKPTIQKQSVSNAEERVIFATNGSRVIYKIKRGDQWVVMENGQESQAYDYVATPTFSLDGSQFAYSAGLDGTVYIIINNVVQETDYTAILEMLFSNDGLKFAYVANTGEGYVVVVNDQVSQVYEQLGTLETDTGTSYLVFSSDGEQLAYEVVVNDGVYVVVNNEAGEIYSEIDNFVFSSDGADYTYQAETDNQEPVTVVNNNDTVTVVQNNTDTDTNTNTDANTNQTSNPSPNSPTGTGTTTNKKSNRSTTTTTYRPGGVDVTINPDQLQYEVCTGDDCNF